ncbi:Lipase, class 3 family-containing protein [Strongyloides ratti]|uniref:Lipase, class 3 family-containing protein n=1 Tax=Strongyloides ratti TaxID=34506 RepID=A0A090L420_STRRB|nr:Lipase, class 3 family-containing protein [Strongyloides ratti]CEF62184.1 Lipase, class 3 family-containing protein [Strongyloides ratti]
MLLLFLFFTLIKINLTSYQNVSFFRKNYYHHDVGKVLYLLSLDSYSRIPGQCISSNIPIISTYSPLTKGKVICDKRGNKCSFFILIDSRAQNMIISISGARSNYQFIQQLHSFTKGTLDFFKMGHVNSYIANAHQCVWEIVKKFLKKKIFTNYSIILTGHSFGGAIAALTALRIQISNYKKSNQIFLYTYGEPRFGTYLFAKNFDARIPNSFRVVYSTDIIPHLPPCKKLKKHRRRFHFFRTNYPCDERSLNSYYHHSTEVWYPKCCNRGCIIKVCKGYPKGEDSNCSNQLNFNLTNIFKYKKYHRGYFNEYNYNNFGIVNQGFNLDC